MAAEEEDDAIATPETESHRREDTLHTETKQRDPLEVTGASLQEQSGEAVKELNRARGVLRDLQLENEELARRLHGSEERLRSSDQEVQSLRRRVRVLEDPHRSGGGTSSEPSQDDLFGHTHTITEGGPLRGDQTRENVRLRREVRDLEETLAVERDHAFKAQQSYQALQRRADDLEREVDAARTEARDVREEFHIYKNNSAMCERAQDDTQAMLQARTQDLEACMTEKESLAQRNHELQEQLEKAMDSLEVAAVDLERMEEERREMRLARADAEMQARKAQERHESLEERISDLQTQLQTRAMGEDQLMNAMHDRLKTMNEDWKAQLEQKDRELAERTVELSTLRQTGLGGEGRLRETLKETNEELVRVNAEMTTMEDDMRKEREEALAELVAQNEALARELKEAQANLKLQSESTQGALAQVTDREEELLVLRKRMNDYEAGVYGLREAQQEIKDIKVQLSLRDKDVVRLTEMVNGRERDVENLVDEVKFLRQEAGITLDHQLDLSTIRLQTHVELESLRAENGRLREEVSALETERVELKRRLRDHVVVQAAHAFAKGRSGDGEQANDANLKLLRENEQRQHELEERLKGKDREVYDLQAKLTSLQREIEQTERGHDKQPDESHLEDALRRERVTSQVLRKEVSSLRAQLTSTSVSAPIPPAVQPAVLSHDSTHTVVEDGKTEELQAYLRDALDELESRDRVMQQLEDDLARYVVQLEETRAQQTVLYRTFVEHEEKQAKSVRDAVQRAEDAEARCADLVVQVKGLTEALETIQLPSGEEEEIRRRAAEALKRTTALQEREADLSRSLAASREEEERLRTENLQLTGDFRDMEHAAREHVTTLRQAVDASEDRARMLAQRLEKRVPRRELERVNVELARLRRRALDHSAREAIFASRCMALEQTERLLREERAEVSRLRIRLEAAHDRLATSMGGPESYSEPKNPAELRELLRIAEEVSEKSRIAEERLAEDLVRKEEQIRQLSEEKEGLEDKLSHAQTAQHDMVKRTDFEAICKEVEECRAEVVRSQGMTENYRERMEANAGYVVALQQDIDTKVKELDSLRTVLRMLQEKSNDASMATRRELEIASLCRRESESATRASRSSAQVVRLLADLARMERLLMNKDKERAQTRERARVEIQSRERENSQLRATLDASPRSELVDTLRSAVLQVTSRAAEAEKALYSEQTKREEAEERLAANEAKRITHKEFAASLRAAGPNTALQTALQEAEGARMEAARACRRESNADERARTLEKRVAKLEQTVSDFEEAIVEEEKAVMRMREEWSRREALLSAELDSTRSQLQEYILKEEMTWRQDAAALHCEEGDVRASKMEQMLQRLESQKAQLVDAAEKMAQLRTELRGVKTRAVAAEEELVRLHSRSAATRDQTPSAAGVTGDVASTATIDALRRQLAVGRESIGTLQQLLQQRDETIVRLQEMLHEARESRLADAKVGEAEIERLTGELLHRGEETVQRLRDDLQGHLGGEHGSIGAGTVIVATLAEMEDLLVEKDRHIAVLSAQVHAAERQASAALAALHEHEGERNVEKENLDRAHRDLKVLFSEVKARTDEITHLKEQLSTERERVSRTTGPPVEEKEKEKEDDDEHDDAQQLRTKLTESNKKIRCLYRTMQQLKEDLANAEERALSHPYTLPDHGKQMVDRTEKLDTLEKELHASRAEIGRTGAALRKAETDLASSQKETARQTAAARKASADAIRVQRTIQGLRAENARLSEQVHALNAGETTPSKIRELEAKLHVLRMRQVSGRAASENDLHSNRRQPQRRPTSVGGPRRAELADLKETIAQRDQEIARLAAELSTIRSENTPQALAKAWTEIQKLEEEVVSLHSTVSTLQRVISVDQQIEIRRLEHEKSRLQDELAECRGKLTMVETEGGRDEGARVHILEEQVSLGQDALHVLEDQILEKDNVNLGLRFDCEEAIQRATRFQKRYQDACETIEALRAHWGDQKMEGEVRRWRAKTRELEDLVESLKGVVLKLQGENDHYRKTTVSNVRHVELLREHKEVKRSLTSVESECEKLRQRANQLDSYEKQTKQATDTLARVKRELRAESRAKEVLREQLTTLTSEGEVLRAERDRLAQASVWSTRQATETALGELRERCRELELRLEQKDTELVTSQDSASREVNDGKKRVEELEREVTGLHTHLGHLAMELASVRGGDGEESADGAYLGRMLLRAQGCDDLEENLHEAERERDALLRENADLRSELSAFDPAFWDEIEQLKFNYAQSLRLLNTYQGSPVDEERSVE